MSLPRDNSNREVDAAQEPWADPLGDTTEVIGLYVRRDKLAALGGARIIGLLGQADQLARVFDELNPAAATFVDDYGAVVTVNP